MSKKLTQVVENIREQFGILDDNAEKQLSGEHGSKTAGKNARAASNALTKLMKEFRAESNAFEK